MGKLRYFEGILTVFYGIFPRQICLYVTWYSIFGQYIAKYRGILTIPRVIRKKIILLIYLWF